MKIRAIRGSNLASLGGRFELDFTKPPLAGAGLFTIVGETGAGKSTILDALCLALYGRYPRLDLGENQKDWIAIGEQEQITVNDPRSILKTGSVDASAEVDLAVGDDLLRAQWRVWRADRKPDGKMQQPERTLYDLKANKPIVSGKKGVDDEIVQRLGLTYDQFRRTVLLAQNDFDAFLRADDRKRADLLEKITGTALYSRISMAAFEQAKSAERALELLQHDLGLIEVLGDEERAALQTAIEEAVSKRKRIEQEKRAANDILTRHKRHDEQQERVSEATLMLQAARQDLAAAEDERALLARLRAVQPLRSVIERASGIERDLKQRLEEQKAVRLRLQSLAEELIQAQAERETVEMEYTTGVAEIEAAAPQLEVAAKLDGELAGLLRQADVLRKAKDGLASKKTELSVQIECRDADIATKSKQKEELANQLDAQSNRLTLLNRMPEIDELFASLATVIKALAGAEAVEEKYRSECTELATRLEAVKSDACKSADHKQKARERLLHQEDLLAALTPVTTRAERDMRSEFASVLDASARATRDEIETDTALQKAIAEQEYATTAKAEAVETLAHIEDSLKALAGKEEQATKALASADLALSEVALRFRAMLVEGEPCPVCGSLDHPRHDDAAATAIVEKLRAEQKAVAALHKQVQSEWQAVQVALAAAETNLNNAESIIAKLQVNAPDLTAASERWAGEVNKCALALGLECDLSGPLAERGEILSQLIDENQAGLKLCGERLEKVREAENGQQQASLELHRLERELQRQEKEARGIEELLKPSQKQLTDAETQSARHSERRNSLIERALLLLTGFDFTTGDLLRDATGVQRHVSQQLAHLAETQCQHDEINSALSSLSDEQAIAVDRMRHLEQQLAEVTRSTEELEVEAAKLAKQRNHLFDGRPLDEIRADFEQKRHRLADAKSVASIRLQKLQTQQEETQQRLTTLEPEIESGQQSVEKASRVRDEALLEAGFELAEAQELLIFDQARKSDLATRMEALEQKRKEADTLLADRRAQLQELAAGLPVSPLRQEVEEAVITAETQLAELGEAIGRNRSRLEQDETARTRRNAAEAKIIKAGAEYELWGSVNEAIGSRDGSSFRRFVQGVTLDHLVAFANEQLRAIYPRYEIERNPLGGLGLQIIDVEMGGDVRGVRSLSGGERFLVSLALALALARLDGRTAFVDTLLIDEGFGTLDARSLDMAVEALERLQGEGRRVGLISHVEALKDRIPVQVIVEKQGDGRSRVRVGETAKAWEG